MNYSRIVIKVGTHSICGKDGYPSLEKIQKIGSQIATLMKQDKQVILVTSGAVGTGARFLNNGVKPKTLELKQACAAVGQPILMSIYKNFFEQYGILTAQILITSEVISNRERYLNARNTFFTLLSKKVLPIVNENDTVSVEEIQFGDNDNLAIQTAEITQSAACFILTDVEGLYENFGQPHQRLIHRVEKIDETIEKMVENKKNGKLSTGGMLSKINAAKKAMALGIPLIILPSYQDDVIIKYLENEKIGTTFISSKKVNSRKKWLYLSSRENGKIMIDAGAKKALLSGKSLLPVGVIDINGKFNRGDLVGIYFENEKIGKGLVNYSYEEMEQIKKISSDKIEEILGYSNGSEVIHRDNFILIAVS